MSDDLLKRRQWFDSLARQVEANLARLDALAPAPTTPGAMGKRRRYHPQVQYPCPCCGYGTLGARGRCEICVVCHWEDDGQDDADANEVRGAPNAEYSLTQARENFRRHRTMYASPERDPFERYGFSERRRALIGELVALYDAMPLASQDELPTLWCRARATTDRIHRLLKEALVPRV